MKIKQNATVKIIHYTGKKFKGEGEVPYLRFIV